MVTSAKKTVTKTKESQIFDFYVPKKVKELIEVEKILSKPVFQKGSRRYAVRVYRSKPKGQNIGYYQNIVKANNLTDLRLKLINNLNWDLKYRWPTGVRVYKNANIDKYNRAGHLGPNLDDHSFFVWYPGDDSAYEVKVNAKTGGLTKQLYEVDSNIPYRRK